MISSDLFARARILDAEDPLRHYRSRFRLPERVIYLNGNSLGPLTTDGEEALARVLDEWRRLAGRSWHDADPPWTDRAEQLGERLAALIRAQPDEVIATGSTTINLHQLLATLFCPAPGRDRILIDGLAFPTDRYAARSHLRLHGLDPASHLLVVPPREDGFLHEDDLVQAMQHKVAVAILPAVVFTTGQLLDIGYLAREASRLGVLLGLDASHSIGCIPHDFRNAAPSFAFWCGYKYLNGGPGAIAGIYLNRKHHGAMPGLAGWFGMPKDRQFLMPDTFEPATGAAALQTGTPALLSLAPLEGALRIIEEAGVETLRRKSLAMTRFLMECADALPEWLELSIATPREEDRRGGHVALRVPYAEVVWKHLSSAGVIADYRRPDLIRLAPSALYNTFDECAEAMRLVARCSEAIR